MCDLGKGSIGETELWQVTQNTESDKEIEPYTNVRAS